MTNIVIFYDGSECGDDTDSCDGNDDLRDLMRAMLKEYNPYLVY